MQRKKGISLIVLVITIVVMIILAAVVIISLNNSKIIERANTAVDKYNSQEVTQLAQMAWSEAYLSGARTEEELRQGVKQGLINAGLNPDEYGMIVTTSGVRKIEKGWLQDGVILTKGDAILEVGDLIQYDSGIDEYTGKWRVLGAEHDRLLILSTGNVGSLGLCGLEGGTYNDTTYDYGLLDSIDKLNEICEPYGNGTGAEKARSIRSEDISRLSNFQPQAEKYTYSWINGGLNYISEDGVSHAMSGNHGTKGFNYVDYNTMTKITIPRNGSGMPTITTVSYGGITINNIISEKAKDMLKGDTNSIYWLATLQIINTANVGYELCYYNYKLAVRSIALYSSLDMSLGTSNWVRCVVELASNVIIGEKDNTLGWSYTI